MLLSDLTKIVLSDSWETNTQKIYIGDYYLSLREVIYMSGNGENLLHKIEIVNWRFNDKLNKFELLIERNGKQETAILNAEFIEAMHDLIPSSDEEKLINGILKAIYAVIKERVLNVRKIDIEIEELRKQHTAARAALTAIPVRGKGCKGSKNDIFRWNGIIKSLAAEKVLLGEKRYLTKLLSIEESDLRGRLAKIIAGRRAEK